MIVTLGLVMWLMTGRARVANTGLTYWAYHFDVFFLTKPDRKEGFGDLRHEWEAS